MRIRKIAENFDPEELKMGIKIEKEHLDVYEGSFAVLEIKWTWEENSV